MRVISVVLGAALSSCAAPFAAPSPDFVEFVLHVPPGQGQVVTTIRFTAAEIASNVHREPSHLYTWLERLERQVDLDPAPETILLRSPRGQPGDTVRVLVDTTGAGLDGLFGAPGVAETLVELPPGPGRIERRLSFPAPSGRKPCDGPRLVSLEVTAPELAAGTDSGLHRVCIQLPTSYDTSPERRYPVVFVFPGFSGHASQNDGFGARAIVDRLGVETGVEVLLVGVETRVAEGTRYLSGARRGGDWVGYVTKRLTAELDQRFRTMPRRAAFGHSTGGWNALSLAIEAPDFLDAVGASSPDPLDLDVWLFEGDTVRPRWTWWQRAEERLGGRGQFRSWATSWSPQGRMLFDERGALRPDVYEAWKTESPMRRPGPATRRLSGRVFLTAGTKDMFDLYAPTLRFVEDLRAQGSEVAWKPTELDHFGATEERFTPLIRFLLERLRPN